jgi:SAM-dependent methyltransferase
LETFAEEAAASLSEGATVLDAGAGHGPYKHHFSKVEYESADFCGIDKEYGEITYICDLVDIPVEDSRYDLIFLSQVLEHIPEPKLVLKELYRILKSGGKLWLSAPLFYEEHEIPYDFYRYTQYGFAHLLESTGFTIERIEWLEGYFGTLSHQLRVAARALPNRPDHYGGGVLGAVWAAIAVVLKPFFFTLSLLFSRLDLRNKYVSSGQCKNYIVVCVKQVLL